MIYAGWPGASYTPYGGAPWTEDETRRLPPVDYLHGDGALFTCYCCRETREIYYRRAGNLLCWDCHSVYRETS